MLFAGRIETIGTLLARWQRIPFNHIVLRFNISPLGLFLRVRLIALAISFCLHI
jgi:hypothetical protein